MIFLLLFFLQSNLASIDPKTTQDDTPSEIIFNPFETLVNPFKTLKPEDSQRLARIFALGFTHLSERKQIYLIQSIFDNNDPATERFKEEFIKFLPISEKQSVQSIVNSLKKQIVPPNYFMLCMNSIDSAYDNENKHLTEADKKFCTNFIKHLIFDSSFTDRLEYLEKKSSIRDRSLQWDNVLTKYNLPKGCPVAYKLLTIHLYYLYNRT